MNLEDSKAEVKRVLNRIFRLTHAEEHEALTALLDAVEEVAEGWKMRLQEIESKNP